MNIVENVSFRNNRDAYNYENVEIDKNDAIFIRNLMWTNKGHVYTRTVTAAIDEISAIGGLYYPLLFLGFALSFIFVDPFRKLDLSIAFSKLKNHICDLEGLILAS